MISFVVFYSDAMETCSNMKFNTKLLDTEAFVEYNPDVSYQLAYLYQLASFKQPTTLFSILAKWLKYCVGMVCWNKCRMISFGLKR